MPVEYYTEKISRGSSPAVSIQSGCMIYLSSVIGRQWPQDCRYVLPGWDKDTRELHLKPLANPDLGAYSVCLSSHGDSLYTCAIRFLKEHGLTIATLAPATWVDGEIVAAIPVKEKVEKI